MLINPYSISGNGYISTDVLKEILRELDNKLTEEDLDNIVDEVDEDSSGTLDFDGKTLFLLPKKPVLDLPLQHKELQIKLILLRGHRYTTTFDTFSGRMETFPEPSKELHSHFLPSFISFTSSPAYHQCLLFPFWNFAWTSASYLILSLLLIFFFRIYGNDGWLIT